METLCLGLAQALQSNHLCSDIILYHGETLIRLDSA